MSKLPTTTTRIWAFWLVIEIWHDFLPEKTNSWLPCLDICLRPKRGVVHCLVPKRAKLLPCNRVKTNLILK
jgi:hypothetical protein